MDLNADLGEGFGHWTLTDDDALLGCRHQRQCGLRFPRGRRLRDAAGLRHRGRQGRPDRCPGRLPRSGRLRASLHGCATRRTHRRDRLPDRRPAGLRRAAGSTVAYVKPHGALYNRAVWDDDQAAAVVEGVRLAGGDLAVLGLPGSRLLDHAAGRGSRRRRGGLRRPRVHPAGHAGPAQRARRGAARRGRSRTPQRRDGRGPGRHRRGRQPDTASRHARCACTATPRARRRWHAGSERRSKQRAWPCGHSHERGHGCRAPVRRHGHRGRHPRPSRRGRSAARRAALR